MTAVPATCCGAPAPIADLQAEIAFRQVWLSEPLQRVPEVADTLALARIGQLAEPGAEIVLDVRGTARRRNNASHRRFGKDIFEEQLRPAGAIEFGCPVGKLASAHMTEQIAVFEGPVDDDGDPARRGNRQQPGLGRPRRQRIGELDEIDAWLALEDASELGPPPGRLMGGPHTPHPPPL